MRRRSKFEEKKNVWKNTELLIWCQNNVTSLTKFSSGLVKRERNKKDKKLLDMYKTLCEIEGVLKKKSFHESFTPQVD